MKAIIDLLFPPVCLVCHGRTAKAQDVICDTCREGIANVMSDYCTKCGTPLRDGICETCSDHELHFDYSRSVFQYGDVIRQMIHQLKYQHRRSPVRVLGKGMRDYVRDNREYGNFDLVTAVPLHRVRKRERGYNQSELLAREVAKELSIPYSEPVKRRVYTQSQTHLNKLQRQDNLRGAFRIRRATPVTGKNIILVDDVFTTGTTVSEVAKTLKQGGANRVAVITASRAG